MTRWKTHVVQAIRPGHDAFGTKVSNIVDKMVAPSARDNYRKTDQVINLALTEIDFLAQKIRRYQYIERYKFHFQSPNPEIGMGFAEHMYLLRNSELYGVLEQGETLIRFASAVGEELGVGDDKAAPKYHKLFKEKFERRLRERHRMTHAHERPSLVSRLLQLGELKTDDERKMVEKTLGMIYGSITAIMEAINKDIPEEKRPPSSKDKKAFQAWYLERVDDEAAIMWKIFSNAVSSAVGLTNSEQPPA